MKESAPSRLWFEGPNYAADAVIINTEQRSLLLIQRHDTGEWALPGGFVDQGDESSLDTARREAHEETGVQIDTIGRLIYTGIVDDPRNTEYAWVETDAYMFCVGDQLEVHAGDDASNTDWHKITAIPPLYASHRAIVEYALRYLD